MADPDDPGFIDCEIPHTDSHDAKCAYIRVPEHNCATQSIFPYVEAYYCWGELGEGSGTRVRLCDLIVCGIL